MTGKALSSGTGRRRITNAHTKAAAAKAPKQRGSAAGVQKYLEDNPGGHVWASDIMNETGLTKGQVQQAISYLRSAGGMKNIITIRPGNAWRYVPKDTMDPAQAPEPDWRPEDNVPAGKRDPEVPQPYAGVDSAVKIRVVGGYDNGSLALDINGQPYLAKPIS